MTGPTLLVLTSYDGKGLAIRILHDPTQEKVKRAHVAMIKQVRKRFSEYGAWPARHVRENMTHLNAYFVDVTERGWPKIDWRWDL